MLSRRDSTPATAWERKDPHRDDDFAGAVILQDGGEDGEVGDAMRRWKSQFDNVWWKSNERPDKGVPACRLRGHGCTMLLLAPTLNRHHLI